MQEDFDISKEFNLPQKKNARSMKFTNNKIFIFLILFITVAVIVFFGYQFIAPFGAKISYQFNSKDIDKVSRLDGAVSSENIENKATNTLVIPQQIIRQNIVTFNLKLLSQKIDGVWVNLKFKGSPKELKIGARGSLKEEYDYKPLYENLLESLKNFENIDNKLIFWQKEKKYMDFNKFIEDPPVDKITGIYFFDSTDISELQSKNAASIKSNKIVIDKALRGSHSFFIKVDNNELNLTIEKQDRNDYKGQDVLLIEIYKGNKKIFTKEIPDDGMEEINGLKLNSQKETINIKNIERGIYRVNLIDKSNGADINIKSVNVNQQKVVFPPQIFIVDENPTKLWTNSSNITILTLHPAGLQTVRLDKKTDLEIKEVAKEYSFSLNANENKAINSSSSASSKVHLLEIPKNDLIIKGDGVFSFSEDAFFDPNLIKSTDLTEVTDLNNIDYIIANYQKVKTDGEWKVAQVYFDPKDIKIDGDKLYFSLESPELSSFGGEIAIDNLEVTVDKPGWFSAKQTSKVNILENNKPENEQNILDKFISFLKNLWPFGKEDGSKEGTEKREEEKVPSKSVSPTKKPTPTLSIKESVKISIQNGGAAPGTASKFLELLKKEGFNNIEAVNAPNSGYQNAIIKYKKDESVKADVIATITELLKNDYSIVAENLSATESGLITIILGEIPTSASPTVTPKTAIPPPSPTIKAR